VADVPGKQMFEKKVFWKRRATTCAKDVARRPPDIRRRTAIILPPTHPEADAGMIIMEQVELSPMSGTNTFAW